ncbi:V-set and immunoglobulin domain-containing protein 8b [Paramormyrops kingsleyae]|uniref:V-set and immunoglobulin domain containing 8b n=1 Tax=Paramormyrops kingsleyae TaxID=1676925 RepID=A0A3B3QED6_9TELE|nr:coxsackievirus and adenovirus receptor homolog [Paramormyrops kingsleyae]XP_023682754.1 coxsackievirus and adenovirus receptor homolog [Paramormyrops kingsleyae]
MWRLTHLTLLCAVTAFLYTGMAAAMQITSTGPQTIQKALGEAVTLGCTYSPGVSDTGELDIEWSIISPDMTQKDRLVLSFTGGQVFGYGPSGRMQQMNFSSPNPANGDASVTLTNLKPSDTSTYQCKVKKAPGVDMRKQTLVVLVPPSMPKCWVNGDEEIGSPVSLRCTSSQGSMPLTYQWTREDGGTLPSMATQNPGTGELLIRNHSESFTGSYMCEVKNNVGQAQCRYNLRAYQPTNKTAVIVGAVIGALLLLLLLLLLIWLLICCCNKRRYEKEVANEIREDAAAPPPSRPSSRNSSFRSVMGYRSHPGVIYSSVKMGPEHGHGRHTPLPSGHGLSYDNQYGYPV